MTDHDFDRWAARFLDRLRALRTCDPGNALVATLEVEQVIENERRRRNDNIRRSLDG